MTAVEIYAAARDEYCNTVERLIQTVAALKRPDERTSDAARICIAELSKQVKNVAPFLAEPQRDKLEDLLDNLLEFDHEGAFQPGAALSGHPEDILAEFLQHFRAAKY